MVPNVHVPDSLRDEAVAKINALVYAAPELLKACEAALARIESDIEGPHRKTEEGDLLRAAIALAKGEKQGQQ